MLVLLRSLRDSKLAGKLEKIDMLDHSQWPVYIKIWTGAELSLFLFQRSL